MVPTWKDQPRAAPFDLAAGAQASDLLSGAIVEVTGKSIRSAS
jgi:hypothetical protein